MYGKKARRLVFLNTATHHMAICKRYSTQTSHAKAYQTRDLRVETYTPFISK